MPSSAATAPHLRRCAAPCELLRQLAAGASACGRKIGAPATCSTVGFVSAFSAPSRSARSVPLNTLWKAADYEYVIRDMEYAVMIVSAELLDVVGAFPTAGDRFVTSSLSAAART